MKTRSLTGLSLGLLVSALLFVGGCTQTNATNAIPSLTNSQPVAVLPPDDQSVSVPSQAEVVIPEPRGEPVLPPSIPPATPLAEVIKLAQAGVDEKVMLTFITNSTASFDLGANDIVYLNDLGVAGPVITAMMQHDQGLKPLPASPAPAVAPEPASETVAAAPSYLNTPSTAPEAGAQPAYVTNNSFYDLLAPYGNWIEVEGYGRCWQPTVVVVNRNWQPYCDRGRWIYTDAGWYWLSDYSWGATAFHYGRWFSHPSWGWCWWPDTVWAPSWVSWRYSGAYCGWAPLPPTACFRPGFGFSYYGSSVGISFGFGLSASCYTFVPWNGFCSARPYQYRVPPHHASQVYTTTTVINSYGAGHNNTVINQGISTDWVREHTRSEVRTVRLRNTAAGAGLAGRREQLERDGRTLTVYRPQWTAPPSGWENGQRSSNPTRTGNPGISSSPQRSRGTLPKATPSVIPIQPPTAPQSVNKASPQSMRALEPTRWNVPTVARSPEAAAGSTPVRNNNEPPVIQSPHQKAAQPPASAPTSSTAFIGGRYNHMQAGGAGRSVWNNPTASSSPVAPGPSTRVNPVPPAVPAPISPPSRPASLERPDRNSNNQNETLGSYGYYAATAPAPQFSASTPGYTPQLAPETTVRSQPRFQPKPGGSNSRWGR